MSYKMFYMIMFIFCMIGLLLYSSNVLSILISLEFLIVCVLMVMMDFYSMENLLEVIIFMVLSVGESLLGLILMLYKVVVSGDDLVESKNVFF